MTKVMQTYDRVGIFNSVEVQEEALEGEWVRVTEKSTKPLDELINQFLERKKATVLSVSSPNIVLLNTSADKKQRTYRCSASIIYRPLEVIQNEQLPGPQEEGINLEGVPATHRRRVIEAIKTGKPDQEGGLETLTNILRQGSEKTGLKAIGIPISSSDKRSGDGQGKRRGVSKSSGSGRKAKKPNRD